jgi:hypothetical protein
MYFLKLAHSGRGRKGLKLEIALNAKHIMIWLVVVGCNVASLRATLRPFISSIPTTHGGNIVLWEWDHCLVPSKQNPTWLEHDILGPGGIIMSGLHVAHV